MVGQTGGQLSFLASAGHSALDPLQFSAMSQDPTAARQTEDEAM